nr:hypothetical protein [Tanacetum cinerariifolium]
KFNSNVAFLEKTRDQMEEEDIKALKRANVDVTLKDVADIAKEVVVDAEIEESADVQELVALQEVVEVVTTAKLMTEVVTVASATITAADTLIPAAIITATSLTLTTAPSAARRKENEDNVVMRYQALKRKPQTEAQSRKNMMIYLRNMAGFKMDYFKAMKYDDIRPIFKKYFNSNELVKERFASSKPKNFSDDFLLTTLTYMFEKPDVQAQVWKNQRTVHGLAKVKSWRLLESCRVHIITFTSTQMILLVERRYPLSKFTLDQMLNNVRLEVEEESEVSLELLRFVRQQQQEGLRPE